MRNRRVVTGALRSQVWSAGYSIFGKAARLAKPSALSIHTRSIVDVSAYYNTYEALEGQKQFSPITGALFMDTGAMQRFYEYAQTEYTPTAMGKLAKALFHQNGEEFRHTHNKSKPAYSLTAELLAEIISYLNDGTLAATEVREKIKSVWRAHHIKVAGDKLPAVRVDALIDTMIAAHKECQKGIFPKELMNTVFMSFLHSKATHRKDLISYMLKLHELNPDLKNEFPLREDEELDEWHVKDGVKILARILEKRTDEKYIKKFLEINFETVAYALLKSRRRLPKVAANRYGFKGEQAKPNCAEAAFHNLTNIILHDSVKDGFNFALLPAGLKPNPGLVTLYQNGEIKLKYLNTLNIGQGFMDLLSDQDNIIYSSKRYEVKSRIQNFIPIMNLLFGSTAETFEELSSQFSDARRKIRFKNIDESEIEITISGEVDEVLRFQFTDHHTTLQAPRFESKSDHEVISGAFIKLVMSNIEIFYPLLPLIDHAWAVQHFVDEAVEKGDLDTLKHMLVYQGKNIDADALPVLVKLATVHNDKICDNYIHFQLKKNPAIAMYAISTGEYACMERFLKLDPELVHFRDSSNGQSLLHKAVQSDDYNMALMLLKAGADVNAKSDSGATPLFCANESNLVCLLVDAGADINAKDHHGDTAAHVAARYRVVAPFKAMVAAGVDINSRGHHGDSLLHSALYGYDRNREILEFILTAHGNPNAINDKGKTPLHFAAARSSVESIDLLMKSSAVIDAKDHAGNTPLHEAARYGDAQMVSKLISLGADVNAINEDLSTPLHLAVSQEQSELINVLLAAGAKVDCVDHKGQTALHRLMAGRMFSNVYTLEVAVVIVKKLLSAGVNRVAVDAEGKTALDLFDEVLHRRITSDRHQLAFLMRIKALLKGSDRDPVCDAMSGIDEERSNYRRMV